MVLQDFETDIMNQIQAAPYTLRDVYVNRMKRLLKIAITLFFFKLITLFLSYFVSILNIKN